MEADEKRAELVRKGLLSRPGERGGIRVGAWLGGLIATCIALAIMAALAIAWLRS
jgi:hypothetical protein